MHARKLLTALRNAISRSRNSRLSPESISPRPALVQKSQSADRTLEETARRGQKAVELLTNELFNESLNALELDLVAQMRATSLADIQSHTRLVMALQATNAVTRHLKHLVHDGHVAAEQIQLRGKRID